ncbi:site-specific integrase [Mangrovitalea sediminis]|uniref:site-specific integrase n=1 Tax=Mangrovitalea sediminis TaxID=1982043 RepID=UPI000BE5CFE4|nr:site-specific integrase [Mangrovitalea sediminis]
MDMTEALEQSRSGLLAEVYGALQPLHLNQRTQQTYLHWITRFILYHGLIDANQLAPSHRQQFLDYLERRLSASRARINQAQQALAFFYERVLGQPVDQPAAQAG